MQRARDALKKKDAASALKGFEAAAGRSRELDEGSGFADAHRWIGLTFHRALDDPTAARAALEEALDASPHNYVVMMDLGKLLAARATTPTRDADSVAIAAWLAGAPAPEPRDQDAELEAARAFARPRGEAGPFETTPAVFETTPPAVQRRKHHGERSPTVQRRSGGGTPWARGLRGGAAAPPPRARDVDIPRARPERTKCPTAADDREEAAR